MLKEREEELRAPAKAEPARIRKSVLYGGVNMRAQQSALVTWQRDTGEVVATPTENITNARIEMRLRTKHFGLSAGKQLGSPAPTQEHPASHGITKL